jgi:nicotinate-nucleotide adenylyltransferase
VIEHTDLDELWLMVSPNNPLKDKNILADEQDRLREAKEAIEQLGDKGIGIVVSDFEFALPRPTYTANTLRELQKQYPEHDFTLIIGEDNLEIFDKWREYQYILDNYRIFVYPRHDCSPYSLPTAKDLQVLSEAPYFDISSTYLRKNLRG